MGQKKQMWAFWANKFGPWFKHPQKVDENGWHKNQDANVESVGLESRGGYICYASYKKGDVQRFMDGFNACRGLWEDFFTS